MGLGDLSESSVWEIIGRSIVNMVLSPQAQCGSNPMLLFVLENALFRRRK